VSHLPDVIHVRVSSRNDPLPSLLVLTRIVMHELNDYWGVFGPTDHDGSLAISRQELEQNALATREYYPEEFAHLETHMSGLIEVRIMDEAAVDRALEAAIELPEYPYPADYVERLRASHAELVKMGRVLMEVEVRAEGGDCEVKAEKPM
jgi:hypothetical protein